MYYCINLILYYILVWTNMYIANILRYLKVCLGIFLNTFEKTFSEVFHFDYTVRFIVKSCEFFSELNRITTLLQINSLNKFLDG